MEGLELNMVYSLGMELSELGSESVCGGRGRGLAL